MKNPTGKIGTVLLAIRESRSTWTLAVLYAGIILPVMSVYAISGAFHRHGPAGVLVWLISSVIGAVFLFFFFLLMFERNVKWLYRAALCSLPILLLSLGLYLYFFIAWNYYPPDSALTSDALET